eukprot:scaffold20571_cov111-Isochrysis_galbana.AAC.10
MAVLRQVGAALINPDHVESRAAPLEAREHGLRQVAQHTPEPIRSHKKSAIGNALVRADRHARASLNDADDDLLGKESGQRRLKARYLARRCSIFATHAVPCDPLRSLCSTALRHPLGRRAVRRARGSLARSGQCHGDSNGSHLPARPEARAGRAPT